MDLNLDALEAAARAASFGAGCVLGDAPMPEIKSGVLWCGVGQSYDSPLTYAVTGPADDEKSAFDAAFIAAANPAVVLELIQRLRTANEQLIHQRVATIEACAVVCEAWGQAKVQKWQDDPEMLEYSEARAWDAMQCAVAVRKLSDEVPHG